VRASRTEEPPTSGGKRDHRISSQAQWRAHLDLLLFPAVGDVRIDSIEIGRMRKVRDQLRASGLAPKTVNKVLTTAAAVFKLAMKDRLLKWNPAAEVERLRIGSGEIGADNRKSDDEAVTEDKVLSPDEIRKLLAHAETGLARTLLFTAAATGVRHDELLALSWNDVDFNAKRITIRRSLSWARVRGSTEPTKPRFYQPKTEAGIRSIPAAPELLAELKVWKLACPPNEHDLLFPSEAGKPAHRKNVIRKILAPALTRAELRTINMHSLRHSFASARIEGGASIAEVQYLMGHAKPSTTLRVYTHFFGKRRESAAVLALTKSLAGASGTLSGRSEAEDDEKESVSA
jgi:integrase